LSELFLLKSELQLSRRLKTWAQAETVTEKKRLVKFISNIQA